MLGFTIIGIIWVALGCARLPTLLREAKLFVHIFQTSSNYTKLQAHWVTFRWVVLPGVLMAPALVVLERSAFFDPPSPDEIYQTAKHIDATLKAWAAEKANEEE